MAAKTKPEFRSPFETIFADAISAYQCAIDPKTNDHLGISDTATYAVDANILLGLYRFDDKQASEVIEKLKALSDSGGSDGRLFIPYQACIELLNNRRHPIDQKCNQLLNNVKEPLNKQKPSGQSDNVQSKPSQNEYEQALQEHKTAYNKKIDELKNEEIKRIEAIRDWHKNYKDDKVMQFMMSLPVSAFGRLYKDDELQGIIIKGLVRFMKYMPPGFKDNGENKEVKKCGDLIIWHQILEYAEKNKKDIILVTNDVKDDRWCRVNVPINEHTHLHHARHELMADFLSLTKRKFNTMTLANFLKLQKASPDLIKEAEKQQLPSHYSKSIATSKMIFRHIASCKESAKQCRAELQSGEATHLLNALNISFMEIATYIHRFFENEGVTPIDFNEEFTSYHERCSNFQLKYIKRSLRKEQVLEHLTYIQNALDELLTLMNDYTAIQDSNELVAYNKQNEVWRDYFPEDR